MSVSRFFQLFEDRSSWVQREVDAALNEIREQCQPWLRESKGNFVWRGLNYPSEDPFTYKTVRKDRKPMNMSNYAHREIDEMFMREHGWLARSTGLFCTGNFRTAKDYGEHTCLMFPVGDVRYLWNPRVEDLYHAVADDVEDFDEQEVEILVAGYTDKNLDVAIQRGVEIMVDCDYYIIVREDLSMDIAKNGIG